MVKLKAKEHLGVFTAMFILSMFIYVLILIEETSVWEIVTTNAIGHYVAFVLGLVYPGVFHKNEKEEGI